MKKFGKLAALLFCLLFSTLSLAETININTADAQALSANIKGVGLKRAESIVAYRDEHGPFKSVDDLAQVSGIGLKLVEQNRANLTVTDKK